MNPLERIKHAGISRHQLSPDRHIAMARLHMLAMDEDHRLDALISRMFCNDRTRLHERHYGRLGWPPHMCCMGDHGSRFSIALSVWCLISDVHSPMDYSPVHARWDMVY